ncbi:hypothetical protein C8R42DRAFT_362196 [Lentinula raphanica]|nr:hypothetical protein C8R42DRAFT_362196 [Lentinula raphanica]
MHLLSSLPNELLSSIVDYIAYTPNPPDSQPEESLFQWASPELISLSLSNRSLRQFCLPYLFANIKTRYSMDAGLVEKDVTLFSKYTKVFVIDVFSERGDQLISQLLPGFKQLFSVELRSCWHRTNLFKTILALPTVTSILVDVLPDESMCNHDLSKVVLGHITLGQALSPHLERYLDRGMKLACLELFVFGSLHSLNSQSGYKISSGVKKIQVHMERSDSVSYSFLSVLSRATHSVLRELWLLDDLETYFARYTPPFLTSFIEESRRQHLSQFFIIKRIGLRRAETHDQSSQEWCVMGLNLITTSGSSSTFLIEILTLVASSFPKLEALDFDLKNHECKYHVNDLARVLGRFSSLKTLSLSGLYKLLDFGNTNPLPPIRQVDSTNAVDMELASAETGVLWYTSRIAKEVTCLDAIHIQDLGDEILMGVLTTHKWRISGWLLVMNDDRDIGGTLSRVTCPAFLEPEVSLETRMLPPDYI